MSKEEKCEQQLCPCMSECPITYAMSFLGGKWKMAIWCALKKDGPTRYNDLKRKINGITNTMLSASLKEMEEVGVVVRRQYNEMPVRVEYSLTEKSDIIEPAIAALGQWGRELLAEKERERA